MGDVASWRAGKGDGGHGDNDEGAARVVMLVTGHEEGPGVRGNADLQLPSRRRGCGEGWRGEERSKVRGQP